MTDVKIDLYAVCAHCDKDLDIVDRGGGVLEVQPCDTCFYKSYSEGHKEGYNEGYEDGRNKGDELE